MSCAVCNRSLYASKRKLWIIAVLQRNETKRSALALNWKWRFFMHWSWFDCAAVALLPFFPVSHSSFIRRSVYAIVSLWRTHNFFFSLLLKLGFLCWRVKKIICCFAVEHWHKTGSLNHNYCLRRCENSSFYCWCRSFFFSLSLYRIR